LTLKERKGDDYGVLALANTRSLLREAAQPTSD